MTKPLLTVRGLKKYFPIKQGLLKKTVGYYKAVDGVSFEINEGETFGLVGESGCGKTTVGKSILRLTEPTDGEILLEGRDIRRMDREALRQERKNMQIIFQDPYGSLNPRMTIEDIIAEPLKKHKLVQGDQLAKQVETILSTVGLSKKEMRKYPHEFSGGQRQRIVIARALAVKPKLIVCDEPVSALGCIRAGADFEFDAGFAKGDGRGLSVHRARHAGSAAYFAARRRDVSGQAGGDRALQRDFLPRDASLFQSAHERRAGARSDHPQKAHHPFG